MKKIFYLLFVIIILIGCKEFEKVFNDEPPTIIITLVDFSKSIPESTINWYNQVITATLLPTLQVNDKLIVLPVDKAAQTSGIEIASIILAEESFSSVQDPPNQKQELIKRRIARFLDTVSVTFSNKFYEAKDQRSKYAVKTDIIGALKQATKYFNENAINSIVILSDMKQDTEEFNLENYLRSKPKPSALIDKISVTDLQNANIFILTGDQPNIGINDFNWLKDFWTVYFDRNNANLVSYESGGVSLLKVKLK